MFIKKQPDAKIGVIVEGFDATTATDAEITDLKRTIYTEKIALVKEQRLSTSAFVALGRRMGEPVSYYEPMYHHPDTELIFVSSNVPKDGQQIGVPRTGKFWHSDYQFMEKPFALTLISPQAVPSGNRGTFFIDMGKAYEALPPHLKDAVGRAKGVQTPRRYFKIRPEDVYRPVGEVLADIEAKTPAVSHNAVVTHPHTGESILYISAGFTDSLTDEQGKNLDDGLLRELLAVTGQLDETYEHPAIHLQRFDVGDLLIWDNRSLVHRALHSTKPEPAESFRVTVYDEHPFDAA